MSGQEEKVEEQEWYGRGSWATDDRYTFEQKLRRWQFDTMMHQRRIRWAELCEELGGISKARLGQLLIAMLDRDLTLFRLEDAIDAITQRRHVSVCTCDDWSGCAVYTSCYVNDARLAEAKKGELELWRGANEVYSDSTESTPTASPRR